MKNTNRPPAEGQASDSTANQKGQTGLQGNRETENQRNTDTETQTRQTTQKIPPLASRVATLPQAVSLSLEGGISSNSIFIFCRGIKAFEITSGAKLTSQELESAFALWWNMAGAELPDDADFDEYRFEFWRVFEKTKTPLGANPLHQAIERADGCPLPPEAARYASPKIKRLVAVCFQLQLLAGDAPFFIGSRDAAALLGTTKPETGLTTLAGLVRDRVLTVAQKGQPGGTRATRFRYNRSANV